MGQRGEIRIKNVNLSFRPTFYSFFVVFHHKTCVFIIFIFFFDKVSNLRNKILTNQKQELVVRHRQWNCIVMMEK